jgi:O-antigen ligase
MTRRIRPYVAPAYLFLCLILGGSAQGVWGSAVLRLLAIAIIAWALLDRRDRQPIPRSLKQLVMLIVLGLALGLIQLVPLPIDTWASLPGRGQFLDGFRLLSLDPRFMPLSLAPYDTLDTLLALLPPLAMLAAMVRFRDFSTVSLAAALIGGTLAGVLLGVLQVTSGDPVHSPWYPYRESNFGLATGFFANSNHMASLLLVTVPFIAALGAAAQKKSGDVRLRSAALALVGGGVLLIILGLALNGSLAGLGLGGPVILASLLVLIGSKARFARAALAVIGIGSLAALAMLWASPVTHGAETSVLSRQQIVSGSVELVREFGPVGTGLGTFEKAYRLSEDPAAVDRYYVNHAHDDYLELAVETGLPGVVLLLLFLAWWVRTVRQMLQSPAADQFAYAGAIASAALLLHSAVDYPLRTAAMSTVFAMCLALIVQSRRDAGSSTDLRPARHLVVG